MTITSRFSSIAALCALSLIAIAGCTSTHGDLPETTYVGPPQPPPELEFYELNQYGEWLDVFPHGPVWRPFAEPGWRPYVHGHWVWSEWGWTWVSYESFGWAVYHYGYWRLSSLWGWVWIPGYDWEPVRVQWIYYGDYVCWAPTPPPGYHLPDPWLSQSAEVWVVVHPQDFLQHDLQRFHVALPQYKDRYHSGMIVHREPPQPADVERATRERVPHVDLRVKKHPSATRTLKKVVLPERQKEIVEKHRPLGEKRTTRDDKSTSKQKSKSTPKKKNSR